MRVVGHLVFFVQVVKLFLRQIDREHRQDTFELVFGHFTLSELVEILEELFDSNSLHDDLGLQSLLDVVRVVGGLHSLLHEPVVDHIKDGSLVFVISGPSISELAQEEYFFLLWVFGHIARENVFGSVDVSTELEVINFSNISLVQIFSCE